MDITQLNGMSQEQLLALSMMGNRQLTSSSDTSSDSDTSGVQDIAFAYLMQNLLNDSKNGSDSNSSAAVEEGSPLVHSGAKQQCAEGINLENLPLIVNGMVPAYYGQSYSQSNTADMSKIMNAVKSASKKYGIDENLILSIINHESNFKPNVTSSAGAQGLMQLMPANFSAYGVTNGYDINQNVDGGTHLLKNCIDQFGGNLSLGLMAYSAGAGTMKSRGVTSSADLYKMPLETRNYVPAVLTDYNNRKNG
ncbi:lytic transglycosylase domain-containing protein [Clostridium sp. BJN0001]|uniref:lytic transglycosylase domain-containing protein n=1 Tax=Clostridium sp. BJN0001 TaxID=2930219 RepID=UPI001FD5E143|nr:lytic transglycosylase domain-containing protein [Clostridium sp. BJN0001]